MSMIQTFQIQLMLMCKSVINNLHKKKQNSLVFFVWKWNYSFAIFQFKVPDIKANEHHPYKEPLESLHTRKLGNNIHIFQIQLILTCKD